MLEGGEGDGAFFGGPSRSSDVFVGSVMMNVRKRGAISARVPGRSSAAFPNNSNLQPLSSSASRNAACSGPRQLDVPPSAAIYQLAMVNEQHLRRMHDEMATGKIIFSWI